MQKVVCDATGKEIEGEPVRQVTVDVTDRLALTVTPHQKVGPKHYAQGDLSPEAAAKIEEALSSLKTVFGKPTPKASGEN